MNERLKVYDEKMTKTMAEFKRENWQRSVQDVRIRMCWIKLSVDYYGAPTPIQQVANVSVPEARMIQIQPWEKSMLKAD